jgi:hypothetical protein
MNKRHNLMLIILLAIMLVIVLDAYHDFIDDKISEVKQTGESIKTSVESNNEVIEVLTHKVIQSKIELNKQQKIMNEKHFWFMIENKELIRGSEGD